VTRFSTASTTPSVAFTPMAVEPSCMHAQGAGSRHKHRSGAQSSDGSEGRRRGVLKLRRWLLGRYEAAEGPRTLMASMAYSTWKSRPSGLKVLTPRSYSLRVRNIAKERAPLLSADELGDTGSFTAHRRLSNWQRSV